MRTLTRRRFLTQAGAAVAAPWVMTRSPTARAAAAPTVTMIHWSHFVPSFNPLLRRQVAEWARSKGVNARVDFISYSDLPARLAAEAQSKSGHDIVQLRVFDASLYRDNLVLMDDVAADLERQWGPFRELGRYLDYVDGHWIAVPWYFWSFPATINTAYWRQIGFGTDNVAALGWEELATAARRLKDLGHPVGVAVSQAFDANDGLYPLLWAYGGRTVDEKGTVVIDSKETADSIEYLKKLFPLMPREVLGWDDASNNQMMLSGQGSIDVTDVVRQNVLLALPLAPRCRDDCRGLCPRCGADRNQVDCGCEDDDIDPRLAPLRDRLLVHGPAGDRGRT